jgi:hypothetical protein
MLKSKNFAKLFLSLIIFAVPLSQAAADFNPNKLIDDKTFSDTQTFGSAQGIQQFLASKNSPLASTDPSFLQKLKEPTDSAIKSGLSDPEPNLGRLRTAAELIWDASSHVGMNPQVILVTLQKEQSLITGDFSADRLQRALDHALGFACPDSGCDQTFQGFYAQLFGGFDAQANRYIGAPGSLMRSFNTSGGRGPSVDAQGQTFGTTIRTSRVNDTIIVNNTLGGPQNPQPTQSVVLQNNSTAALYRYTPHVYNGNYNFWKFFDQWFRYQNGSLLRLPSDNNTYIINNGLKSLIPNFVIQSRQLNPGNIITVSPTELSSIDAGPTYGPADNVIIKIDSDLTNKLYVFENSQKHPISSFVLSQRGLVAASALTVSKPEADLFSTAELLTPKEGTVIKGDASGTVYVITDKKKMALSGFTFKQYGYTYKSINVLPQDEVTQYTDGGFLLPKNGTLVKANNNPAVYQIDNRLLHPISSTVFRLRKLSLKSVAVLNSGELAGATLGLYVTPPEKTFFRTPNGAVYYFVGGRKHSLSAFVFKQRKVSPVFLTADEATVINGGSALPPKDGTLIRSNQSGTIYVIQKGLKIALDARTWAVGYRKAKPIILSQSEVDSYLAPGDIEQ